MRSRPERFKPNDGGKWIDDDDFGFDAMLKIDGDFGSDAVRLAYAQFICDKLNAAPNVQPKNTEKAEAVQWLRGFVASMDETDAATQAPAPAHPLDELTANAEALGLYDEPAPVPEVPAGMVLVKAYAECGKFADNNPGLRADCARRLERGEPCEKCPTRAVQAPAVVDGKPLTYSSTQATNCASCGKHKHTPLRIDAMGGYVCLTCIDKKLGGLLGEFGCEDDPQRKDAERYRWLRGDGSHGFGAPRWSRWQVQVWGGNPLHWQNVAGEALDAEIDTAIESDVPVQGSEQ